MARPKKEEEAKENFAKTMCYAKFLNLYHNITPNPNDSCLSCKGYDKKCKDYKLGGILDINSDKNSSKSKVYLSKKDKPKIKNKN